MDFINVLNYASWMATLSLSLSLSLSLCVCVCVCVCVDLFVLSCFAWYGISIFPCINFCTYYSYHVKMKMPML